MPHSRDSLVLLPGSRRVLEPPPELREGTVERQIFVQTAAAVPPDHFSGEDLSLLAEYARSAALARYAGEELLANPVVGKTVNPWLATYGNAVRQNDDARDQAQNRSARAIGEHQEGQAGPAAELLRSQSRSPVIRTGSTEGGRWMDAQVVKPKRKPSVDDEALERALAAALARQQASNVPRRDGLTQIESMLEDRPRREVCEFASDSEQMHALGLRPWMFPPAWLDLNDRDPEHADGVALLRRLINNNLSKYEPNPDAALARVEAPPAT